MATPALRLSAVGAAKAVGLTAGFESPHAIVMQDTNNVVVWLAPHPVVAKVGVWPHSREVLAREAEVCRELAGRAAPCAMPVGPMIVDHASGLPVSLWHRLEAVPGARSSAGELATMLHRVHAALRDCGITLPSFLVSVDHAREALFDDHRMGALPRDDLTLLRDAFDAWATVARDLSAPQQPLHGEPHLGNVIVTAEGPQLVDFEAVSHGPREWDLASMEEEVARAFGAVDEDLLARLRLLNSARVATWCWAGAAQPVLRAHGEHHLDIVRRAVRR